MLSSGYPHPVPTKLERRMNLIVCFLGWGTATTEERVLTEGAVYVQGSSPGLNM